MSMERTESSDDDQSLLDQVLNNLYDFGKQAVSDVASSVLLCSE